MQKLISIDIKADFGLLKKPDTNEPVYLTFNMIHKPALLGVFGAIIGLEGFKKHGELPEYYEKLNDLKIGIQPLNHENGNYQKTVITYNNTTGMASDEQGGNLMVSEQTLIAPSFRIFVLIDNNNEYHQKLLEYLKENKAEYLPYLGKNDFSLWWDNNDYNEYDFKEFEPDKEFQISSLFIKEESVKEGRRKPRFIPGMKVSSEKQYAYFERLPIGYEDAPLFQYKYEDFSFTNWQLQQDYVLPSSYPLLKINNDEIIQIF